MSGINLNFSVLGLGFSIECKLTDAPSSTMRPVTEQALEETID